MNIFYVILILESLVFVSIGIDERRGDNKSSMLLISLLAITIAIVFGLSVMAIGTHGVSNG